MHRIVVALSFYALVLAGFAAVVFEFMPPEPATVEGAWKQAPKNTASLAQRAGMAFLEGNSSLGISLLTQEILGAPSPRAYRDRGLAYMQLGQFDEAIDNYDEALRLFPLEYGLQEERALSYIRKKAFARAIADLNECLYAAPSQRAFHARALAYFLSEDYDQAAVELTAILEHENLLPPPRGGPVPVKKPYALPICLRNRAACYRLAGNIPQAIADCTRAIELSSTDLSNYAERAKAYLKLGDYARALDDAERTIGPASAANCDDYDLRGRVYLANGMYRQARDDFTRAIAADPRPAYYLHRSQAYAGLAEPDRAQADAERGERAIKLARPAAEFGWPWLFPFETLALAVLAKDD